jgi:alanyl-tRNA synthetase
MTERLYYSDCYLREFDARVIDSADGGRRVYLDRTAFYPTSGGQPFDLGTLGGVRVEEIADEDDRIAHVLAAPLTAAEVRGQEVRGQVDWTRRYDHMQQHTGQHLLSAALIELFNTPTLSFHMSADTSTIDVESPGFNEKQIARAIERCAELVAASLPVTISYEDASVDLGLRKASQRTGTLRIVSIEGVDRSACGGTHVRSTSELGPILIRKVDKMRGNARLEFVCGGRALKQARRDYLLLEEISRAVSTPPAEAPALIAGLGAKIKSLEKTAQKLASDLAQREGRELHAATEPDGSGIRRVTQRGTIDDATRARAQAFTAGGKAVFLAICENPPSVLLAASPDSGVHAGDRVKAFVTAAGGRGGGNPSLAQGSVPSAEALAKSEDLISA